MEEWKEYKLGDLYDVHNGLSKGGKFFGSGYPFLSFKTVFNNYFLPPVLPDLVLSNEKEQSGYDIKRGDVFVTRTSETPEELGMSSVALKDYPFATYNGFTKRLRPKDANTIYPEFIGYYLRSTKFRALFYGLASSMSTRASLANGDLLGMRVFLPSIETQESIARILKSLDDKIEVNNRINDNLEQQAQALFKSWFVDFEPFKDGEFVESELGMIPKGWRVGKLGEICNVFTGKKDVKQSQPIGLYPFFSCSPNHTYSNEYIYDGPSIIIAGNGSYTGRTSFYFGKFDLYQRTYACTIKEGFNEKIISFLYYMMKCLFEPVKMGGTRGSSIPYIVMNDIVLQKFALDNSLVEKYSDFAYNVMKQIQQNNQESRRLASLRDTLLPRLMSGELKVDEIEKKNLSNSTRL